MAININIGGCNVEGGLLNNVSAKGVGALNINIQDTNIKEGYVLQNISEVPVSPQFSSTNSNKKPQGAFDEESFLRQLKEAIVGQYEEKDSGQKRR